MRSNGFKVIRTRARPISARVASMGDLLCLFTGAAPSGRGLTGNDTEIAKQSSQQNPHASASHQNRDWIHMRPEYFDGMQMHEDFAVMAALR